MTYSDMAMAEEAAAATTTELVELTPQPDLFGPVAEALSLQDVQRAIRGVSRPRDLRPLIQKSTHDPLANMLELAMKAKNAGNDSLAFERFAVVLPYVWTVVKSQGLPGQEGGGAGAGEVIYRWASPGASDAEAVG